MAEIKWLTVEINRRQRLQGMTKAAIGRHLVADLDVPEATVKNWIQNHRSPGSAMVKKQIVASLDRLEQQQVNTVKTSPLGKKISFGKPIS